MQKTVFALRMRLRGLESGIAAGCMTIAVLSHASKEQLPKADGYVNAPKDVVIRRVDGGFELDV